jgi:hypothetical protein
MDLIKHYSILIENKDIHRLNSEELKVILKDFAEKYHALKLQQTGVSTCFLEDYIDDLFGNEITYKQTSCCKTAPMTNENYCPNCGNKILK